MLLFKLGRTFVSFTPVLTCLYCAFKINDENAGTHLINRFSCQQRNTKNTRKIYIFMELEIVRKRWFLLK